MSASAKRTTILPAGEQVPVLGQGTWFLGYRVERRDQEIAALRLGIDLGMTLIDTAEMYGNGASEALVGEAIAGRRDEIFLVSKVLPGNASLDGTVAACERSLRHLGTDRLDLYLLHWRGGTPLAETIGAFERLKDAGKIRHWGVSNFDPDDMVELIGAPGGGAVQANQVIYNPTRRGIEFDLLPWCAEHGLPIMAYCPIEQGRLADHPTLRTIAAGHGATSAQIALAWLLRQDGVIAIPKAAKATHVGDNARALDIKLSADDIAQIDKAFPPPSGPMPLEIV